ncbi:MAG: flagellar motor protein MotB [Pseudobdellovibrio sp.]
MANNSNSTENEKTDHKYYDSLEENFVAVVHDDDHDEFHKPAEEGEGPWLVSYADLMTLLMGFFALVASFSKPDVKAFEEVKKSAAEKFGGEYKEPYKDLEGKINQSLKAYGLDGKVKVSRAADGVTLKFEGTALFDSGQFVIKPEGAQILHAVTAGIRQDIPKFKLSVEGHTDNVPMSHPIIASNWELSAIRSARVAQVMESDGFKKEQITIQGWGETRPEVPNLTPEGVPIPENQAKNRRVTLKISE